MKLRLIGILVAALMAGAAMADPADDVRDGRDLDFDLKGMTYSYTGALSGSGTVLDSDAPATMAAKDSGTLNFVINTASLGLPFNVNMQMVGTKISPTRVKWTTNTLVHQCVTIDVNGTPTQVLVERITGQLLTDLSYVPTFFDSVCGRCYNVRLDDTANNTDSFINAEAYALCLQNIVTRINYHAENIDIVAFSGVGRVPASSVTLFRGAALSGGISNLGDSDDSYLVIRPGVVFASSDYPVQAILSATAPTASPSGLRFLLEAKASAANVNQRIELFDFSTGQYVVVDQRTATLSDSITQYTVPANQPDFVDPTTLSIKARIGFKAMSAVFSYPWTASLDQVYWLFEP
jgi:hypothetical protein